MAKFVFDALSLKQGVALARTVKPETGDYCFRFSEDSVTIFSYDRRRYVRSVVRCKESKDVASGYRSEEFYVTMDRVALFDTELETLSVAINSKSLTLKAEGGGVSRSASLKPRSVKSRRPPVPDLPKTAPIMDVDAPSFDLLLKQLSCSALIRETKTDDDMRVNQAHFYSESGCATSIARYYGTVVFLDGLSVDMSVVSSDIPLLRAFCTKSSKGRVSIYQDDDRLYAVDSATGSSVAFSRVSSKRPPLSVLSDSGYSHALKMDSTPLLKCLNWASLAVDGTQRIGLVVNPSTSELELKSGTEEISRLSCEVLQGSGFEADFPVRHLATLVSYLSGDIVMSFGHKDMPSVMCVHAHEGAVNARHYVQSMVKR